MEQLLLQLQKELEGANVQYDSMSTMARIGNSQARVFSAVSVSVVAPLVLTKDSKPILPNPVLTRH